MSALRCEPPEELRGVDGWHWVQHVRANTPALVQWQRHVRKPEIWGWTWLSEDGWKTAEEFSTYGWRYLAPVATPAEVDALRAIESTTRDFVAWTISPANGFTDPENMLVCAEWHNLRAALEDKP